LADPATPPLAADEVARALAEDRAIEDITTRLLGASASTPMVGRFVAGARCVVAGTYLVGEVYRQLDPDVRVEVSVGEGDWAEPGATIATARGAAHALLAGERVSLNFLQRLSGIATSTRRVVDAVAGTGAVITDTRKTTPGLRAFEKYAVRAGGGTPHRTSLADAILFKDNHWVVLSAHGRRLADALRAAPPGIAIEVEVETDEQLEEALAAGVTRILADNQTPARIAEWVRRAGPGVAIEASGGITAESARAYAEAGARFISIGALTHSAPSVAIGFELSPA